MNNTTILKLINLLNEDKKQEIKEILTHELLKNEDKTKANLFTAVKNYIKKMDNSRPKLKAIQNRNGTQYILNGYNMFVFNEHKHELDALPQETEDTLPYENILHKNKEQTKLTQDDIFVLQNLKKFIAWSKAQSDYNKNETIKIVFDNKVFDTEYLLDIYNICDHDFDTWQKCITTEKYETATQIMTKDIIILVLPIRSRTQQDTQSFINETNEKLNKFKEELKGEN